MFIARLFAWQIVDGDKYKEVSNIAAAYSVPTQAVRGEIYDIDGNPLAINKAIYNLQISKLYIEKDNENNVIIKLLDLIENLNIPWEDELPIALENDGVYSFRQDEDDKISYLKKDILELDENASAKECINALTLRYSLDVGVMTERMRRNTISVRYSMETKGYSMTQPFTLAKDLSKKAVAFISEQTQDLPGVKIAIEYERYNPDGALAPHIIGTVGAISEEEYNKLKTQGYDFNDTIGKSGIESGMESYLKGEEGELLMIKSADGTVEKASESKEASPGNRVYLTLNSELQKIANESLAANITAARENGIVQGEENSGEDCNSGAVVVMNVKDFSVMAAASYPSYDMEKYSEYDYYNKLINDKHTPLFNRAFNGAYPPGSVFKCCVAAAALQENIITPGTEINCTHIYDYYKADPVRCLGTHGDTNLYDAMSQSCNYYFADVGRMLGINTMYLYAQRFGLGVKTGVEMYESKGTLAGRDNDIWYDANTVKAAIGQSDNAFTPLQLATYVSTIANNGVRLKTHLVNRVESFDGSKVIYENDINSPEVVQKTGISDSNMKTLKKAMREVVASGTAQSIFGDYEIKIAAKTGTAENSGSDHTTFICYAPYDKPEIAIAVVLEHGAKGKYSMSVAKDIMDEYFKIDRTNTDTDTSSDNENN
ncbi:MAG: penicillin-binding transpeptidase domain-containing protein [Clostridia bacterium]|nr:penicillin-binding transpeptidase domain-containing protein [Clostridia bacterium]